MAVQNRRGPYDDFDPNKMLPGEWACVTNGDPGASDGKSVYMCFEAGKVKRMATYDDMKDSINEATQDVQKEFLDGASEDLQQATQEAQTAAERAAQAASDAESSVAEAERALELANDAVTSANAAADRANEAADNVKNDFYGARSTFPETGEANKLYIDNTVNPAVSYIWNGSDYVSAGGVGSAKDLDYDNSSSGLTSDNVQGAIDENAAAISELKTSNLNVDLTPASDVSQVYEYFRYSVIGNICIVDVGGITFGSYGWGKSAVDSGLPVAKTRPVGVLTTDPGATNQPGSTTTIYGKIGGDYLSVQVPPGMEGKYLYGQIIYII